MKLGDTLAALDRVQKSTLFKIVASGVVLALAIAVIITYAVQANSAATRKDLDRLEVPAELRNAAEAKPTTPPPGAPEAGQPEAPAEDSGAIARDMLSRYEAFVQAVNDIKDRRVDPVGVATGVCIGAGVVLIIIWLGVLLTYLGAALVGAVLVLPMLKWGGPTTVSLGWFVLGVLVLAVMFSAMIEGLRVVLSPSHPVTSIARNVVSEAVRMKISLVFIILLIFGMAALPQLLDSDKELRYRVQSFLTWGIGGTYWLIAILTIFLACATVAFEQRDKIIWQTMTKPVRAWQYVLGKWLGVVGVAAVLLVVSTSGALMFTEYLRRQPASGETRPFVSQDPSTPVSQDRLMLETQVLTAQESVRPALPELDMEARQKMLEARIAKALADNPLYVATADEKNKMLAEMDKEELTQYFSITPGTGKEYMFAGLGDAKQRRSIVTLRFKVHAGSDLPTDTYRLTFIPLGGPSFVREVRLGQMLTKPLSSDDIVDVEYPPNSGQHVGYVRMRVFNGDLERRTMNKEAISFATDGFEITYPVGSFIPNFGRVVVVMWLKLAFLAMIGIVMGTFLSFAVAALTSFGVFLCAEGSSFLAESLDSFDVVDSDQTFMWWRVPIRFVGECVTAVFSSYSRMDPAERLVGGRYFPWGRPVLDMVDFFGLFHFPFPTIHPWDSLLGAVLTFGTVAVVLWAIGSLIFRRRELAIYSGQ